MFTIILSLNYFISSITQMSTPFQVLINLMWPNLTTLHQSETLNPKHSFTIRPQVIIQWQGKGWLYKVLSDQGTLVCLPPTSHSLCMVRC